MTCLKPIFFPFLFILTLLPVVAAENALELPIDEISYRNSISSTSEELPVTREISESANNDAPLGLQYPETPQTSQSCGETLRRSWYENKLLCSVLILGSTGIIIYGIVKGHHP